MLNAKTDIIFRTNKINRLYRLKVEKKNATPLFEIATYERRGKKAFEAGGDYFQ